MPGIERRSDNFPSWENRESGSWKFYHDGDKIIPDRFLPRGQDCSFGLLLNRCFINLIILYERFFKK